MSLALPRSTSVTTDVALSMRDVGKSYRISRSGERPVTLAEQVLSSLDPRRRRVREEFWALRGLDLDVAQGTVLGILGRNGAGKSTLLKVLSRVTAPTTGRIDLHGRVGSLLEVGSGFHPELTGRENIFLNGAVLGMRRAEVSRHFDEIVAFAGVERFLDTPVKRYSSGMYVRLAFAVAAHLETEILIIDEVLAVGDDEFQQRCLGKMRETAHSGRTVLYVSHQLASLQELCDRAILLDGGRIAADGEPSDVVATYLARLRERSGSSGTTDRQHRQGTGEVRLASVTTDMPTYRPEEPRTFSLTFDLVDVDFTAPMYATVVVVDDRGRWILQLDSRVAGTWIDPQRPSRVTIELARPWLKPGSYHVNAYMSSAGLLDGWEAATTFDVMPVLPYGGAAPDDAFTHAMVLPEFDCHVHPEEGLR